jgi:hypothetical protein
MSFTRSKNDRGNYDLESRGVVMQAQNLMFENSPNGQAFTRNLAGDGLLFGKIPGRDLAFNSCDIESELYGIGANNMIKPLVKVEPQPIPLKSLNIYKKQELQLPSDLILEKNQRQLPFN